MHEIKGEGYTTHVLIEAQLEELSQPREVANGAHQEDSCPEEIEPLVIIDCLRLEESQPGPTGGGSKYIDIYIDMGNSSKV